MMAWCCPCFPLGQLSEKVNCLSHTVVVSVTIIGMVLFAIIAAVTGVSLNGIIAIFIIAVLTVVRGRVRDALNINGDTCEDCCCSFWCTCCTLAQLSRTVYNYRDGDPATCGEKGEPQWWHAAGPGTIGQNPMQQPYHPPGQGQGQGQAPTAPATPYMAPAPGNDMYKPVEPQHPTG